MKEKKDQEVKVATFKRINGSGKVSEVKVVVDMNDKPVPIIPKELKEDETKAKEYWSKKANNINDLYRLGLILKTAKESVNGNNNAFGIYRERTFAGMSMKYASYSIYLFDNFKEIKKMFEKKEIDFRNFGNPISIYNRYKAELKKDKDTDTDKDKDKGNDLRETPELTDLTPSEKVESFLGAFNSVIAEVNAGHFKKEEIESLLKAIDHNVKLIEKAVDVKKAA